MPNKDFHLLTYTKGCAGKLNREFNLGINNLLAIRNGVPFNQKRKNADPLLIKRHFLSKEDILKIGKSLNLALKLEQFNYCLTLSNNQLVFQEFQKPIPWVLLEEYKLNISQEALRVIFQKDPYHENPANPNFTPNINRSEQYTIKLQPYLDFTLKPSKYDYWINHRWNNQKISDNPSSIQL